MKRIAQYILLCTLSLCTFGCRPESDDLLSFGQADGQAYGNAESSYEQQFISFWTAMNCNYGIWDYEEENGFDWDEVYDTYLPKFQALDKQQQVSDDELRALYDNIINPLHDGHLYVQIKNLKSGTFLNYVPSSIRNKARADYQQASNFLPTVYSSKTGDMHLEKYSCVNTSPVSIIQTIVNTVGAAVLQQWQEYHQKGSLTESEQFIYDYCEAFLDDAVQLTTYTNQNQVVNFYNSMSAKYAALCQHLQVEMPKVDNKLASYGIAVETGLFQSGIPYLRFNHFYMSIYLDDDIFAEIAADTSNVNSKALKVAVKAVWKEWFDNIQELKRTNSLRGVIIDVRNNGGGMLNDYQYVLGAMLPSGGYASHKARCKNGTGRYDYAPLVDFTYPTYKGEHAIISEEPIVVLTNCSSVSMSEMTAIGAKTLPNGRVVGTCSWGGLSALNTDPASYSETYASAFGEENKTAFYAYIPKYVSILPGLGVQEGVGVTPDIEVPLDMDLYNSTGRDSQLERAIEYIITGN